MTIKSIYLKDFRNYKESLIHFSAETNVIWGENAQGKTNLLEALYLFIIGRSFRTLHLSDLVHFGASSFYLEALFEKNGIEQILKFSFDGVERRIIYNATPLPSLSALLGVLNGVLLSPEDNILIKGGPQARRQFLDLLIAQVNPLYLHHLSRYFKAMKNRNILLKKNSLETIEVWEEQMALSSAFLTALRAKTLDEVAHLSESETLSSDKINLKYLSPGYHAAGIDQQELYSFFLRQLRKNRARECELKLTLSGPHRDDFSILLHQKEAKFFGSEGQQRGCIATLKLAQWRWIYATCGIMPLFCIDDAGISFDTLRERELYKRLEGLGQVFVTTIHPISLPAHAIYIEQGLQRVCDEPKRHSRGSLHKP